MYYMKISRCIHSNSKRTFQFNELKMHILMLLDAETLII